MTEWEKVTNTLKQCKKDFWKLDMHILEWIDISLFMKKVFEIFIPCSIFVSFFVRKPTNMPNFKMG